MEKIISILAAAIAIIAWLVPQIKFSIKVAISAIFLLVVIFILFRKTNYYLHNKYFHKDNFFVFCEEFPPSLREEHIFYYKYVLVVGSRYKNDFNIDNLQIVFNTTASIISYDLLLCDFDNEMIKIKIKDFSILDIKLKKLKPLDVFAIGIDCKLDFKDDFPFIDSKGLEYYNVDANLKGKYEFFKKEHSFSKNIRLVTAPVVWQKTNILFDIVRVLDLRKTTTHDRLSTLGRFSSEDGGKSVKFFGLMDKPLLVEYNDSKRIIQYKSTNPFSFFFYPIRVVISKSNDVAILCMLGPFDRFEP